MIIKRLRLKSYRNLNDIEVYPSEGINIIYGKNAQGKTNLLESMWLFTGCKSFRGTKDAELVAFGKDFARLDLDFFAYGRDQEASIIIENNRRAALNGVSLNSPMRLMGEFLAVVFTPSHLMLVQAGPAERRRFLDTAISQINKRYAKALKEHNKILLQRNQLLKDIIKHSQLLDTLDFWDCQLSAVSKFILEERLKYTEKIQRFTREIYSGLSNSSENMEVSYIRKLSQSNAENIEPLLLLKNARKEDILSGTTNYGIHRDDLYIKIDDKSARDFGSQGQQRSAALSLKLAEARLFKEFSGEQPIALLDDVMSELDPGRQDYILNHIKDWQVFISCCDPSAKLKMCHGKSFKMSEGCVFL